MLKIDLLARKVGQQVTNRFGPVLQRGCEVTKAGGVLNRNNYGGE